MFRKKLETKVQIFKVLIPAFQYILFILVARKMKKKEKQKKRKAYEPKLTPEGNALVYLSLFIVFNFSFLLGMWT